MASRFATVKEEPILSINEAPVPKNTKMVTPFGLAVFNVKLFNHFNSDFTALAKEKVQGLVYVNCRAICDCSRETYYKQ